MPERQPYCLSMIVCDTVVRDASTGKSTALGLFSECRAPGFPANMSFTVLFEVTDCLDQVELRLELVPASFHFEDGSTPVFSEILPMECSDPLTVLTGIAEVRTTIPNAGVYHLELYAGSSPLMARRIVVSEVK